jgi:hypothetical protein
MNQLNCTECFEPPNEMLVPGNIFPSCVLCVTSVRVVVRQLCRLNEECGRQLTASVVQWSEVPVPGSIPCASRFSYQQSVWNGVHSALVRINEELLERQVAPPV